MPDSDSQMGGRKKLRGPSYGDNPVFRSSHTPIGRPKSPLPRSPHLISRLSPSPGTWFGFEVWLTGSEEPRRAQVHKSRLKADGKKSDKLCVRPILGAEQCPAATATAAATSSSFPSVGGPLRQLLISICQCNRRSHP